MKRYNYKILKESSLSRIYQHMLEHDTGFITAYRGSSDCGTGVPYTKKDNQKRNKSLLAKIQSKRYNVTSVKGTYIENYGSPEAQEVGEHVFFVVDSNDTGKLKGDLKKWGEEFEQDSILFIDQGAQSGSLIGTNHCENGYPGYGKIVKLKNPVFGESGEFFTRVNGRPFVFKESVGTVHPLPEGYFGRMGCKAVANQPWEELE